MQNCCYYTVGCRSSCTYLHSMFSALFRSSSAYWNATRAFMILSAMSCFAGIIAGILSFAHFSAFERFNRSFASGTMFFVSSESGEHSHMVTHVSESPFSQFAYCVILGQSSPGMPWKLSQSDNIHFLLRIFILICYSLCPLCQLSLFCLQWPFTPG